MKKLFAVFTLLSMLSGFVVPAFADVAAAPASAAAAEAGAAAVSANAGTTNPLNMDSSVITANSLFMSFSL